MDSITLLRYLSSLSTYIETDGAIAMDPAGSISPAYVRPYFGNLAAMGFITGYQNLGDSSYLRAAEGWVKWYIEQASKTHWVITDMQGGPGHWLPWNQPKSTLPYDSVDGYIGTFLVLANSVYHLTKDAALKHSIKQAGPHVLAAVAKALQGNGAPAAHLTSEFLPPDGTFCYTEDNCEMYGGLEAAIAMGATTPTLKPRIVAPQMLQAILNTLYSVDHFLDAVALDGTHTDLPPGNSWKSGDQIQIFSIARLPRRPQTVSLYTAMQQYYGKIPSQLAHPDSQTEQDNVDQVVWWGLAALAMNDTTTVNDMAQRLAGYDPSTDRAGVHHIGLACEILAAATRTPC